MGELKMATYTQKEPSDLAKRRKVQKAMQVLNFDTGTAFTVEQVKARFVSYVKATHPDSNGGKTLPGPTIQQMREAKDTLLKHLEEKENG
jgi:hypothetical protein